MATRTGVYADPIGIPNGFNSGPPVKPTHAGVVQKLTGSAETVAWLMRAQDQGRPAGSNYTVWLSLSADFNGDGYATGIPTPSGAIVAGSVVGTKVIG